MQETEFKDLFDYYSKHVNPTTGTWSATENSDAEHAAMGGLLINDIALGIKDFVEANTPAIKNDPDVTLVNYKAAAWLGLRETDAYTKFKTETGETDQSQTIKYQLITSGTTSGCN